MNQFLRPVKSNIPLQCAGVHKLDKGVYKLTKRSIGVRVKEHISNIRMAGTRLLAEDVTVRMKKNMLNWFVHVERMSDERMAQLGGDLG